MSGYYTDLTFDEQQKVLSAMVSLKINANSGKTLTRQDINTAFLQATGKPLSIEYMRDPAVVSLIGLIAPNIPAPRGFMKNSPQGEVDHATAITDRNMEARGLPVPKSPVKAPGGTRYSAGAANNSRYGR